VQTTSLRNVYSQRDLLLAWTFRIVRARYQQSVLGFLWAILQPAATVLVFSIIFTQIVPINTGDVSYVIFSFAAMVPWTFFNASLNDMVNSLVENMGLVTKIYFPREILPVAALLARFVDFLIASCMLVVLMIFFRIPIFPAGLLFLPLIIAIQISLSVGIGLVGAALNVFYRDIKHVITLALQLWFYASPVIYPIERVPEGLRTIYFLNPMAGIISAYRNVLLYESFPDSTLLISALMAIFILAMGYWFFKRVEFQFADVV
jgi:lipopolysaccharide transport system permease protein